MMVRAPSFSTARRVSMTCSSTSSPGTTAANLTRPEESLQKSLAQLL